MPSADRLDIRDKHNVRDLQEVRDRQEARDRQEVRPDSKQEVCDYTSASDYRDLPTPRHPRDNTDMDWSSRNGRSLSPTGRMSRSASSEKELSRYLDEGRHSTDVPTATATGPRNTR